MAFVSKLFRNGFATQSSNFVNKLHKISKKCDKIPSKPVVYPISPNLLPPRTKIDKDTIEHLERLSLVDFANEEGIRRLEDAITFADQLSLVDTTNVEPLVTVLEDRNLFLRDDDVKETNTREDVLFNAVLKEENYFVAPPGNIPIKPKADKYFQESSENDSSSN